MTRIALRVALAAAFVVSLIGVAAEAASWLTGSPVFVQQFRAVLWGAGRDFLFAAAALVGGAAVIGAVIFLLLSSHSPIPRVRSFWSRRLPVYRRDPS